MTKKKAQRTAVPREVPKYFESPESSTIAGASYYQQQGRWDMRVSFKRGNAPIDHYIYKDVPADVWADFVEAESKGQFFTVRIRPNYRGERIVSTSTAAQGQGIGGRL